MARDIKRKVLPRNLIFCWLWWQRGIYRAAFAASRVPSRPEFPIRISSYAKKKVTSHPVTQPYRTRRHLCLEKANFGLPFTISQNQYHKNRIEQNSSQLRRSSPLSHPNPIRRNPPTPPRLLLRSSTLSSTPRSSSQSPSIRSPTPLSQCPPPTRMNRRITLHQRSISPHRPLRKPPRRNSYPLHHSLTLPPRLLVAVVLLPLRRRH